jgi:hypothetical protein
VQKKKYLVFFGTFLNEKYLSLLNLALQSLTVFSDLSQVQVCVLTSPSLVGKVQEIGKNANVSLQIECRPYTTVFEAACARFDWETIVGVDSYEKILYLDTDMLVLKDISKVFESVDPGTGIAAVEEGEMGMPNMGGDLFRKEEGSWDIKMPGMNSGILLFRPCAEVREVFKDAREAASASAASPPACMDQPFLSWATIRKDRFVRGSLKGIAGLFEKGWPDDFEDLTLCHFSFPIGNADHKMKRMKEFLNFMLIDEKDGGTDEEWEQTEWGWRVEVCKIVFHKGRKLSTPWGSGTWKPVGPGMVQATWKGFTHFCKKMHGGLRSLRIGDFDRADAMVLKDAPAPVAKVTEDSGIPLFFQGGAVQWQKLVV